ncbi:unnamed protein product [Ectocarpus sp. 12 AP-2014]
MEDGGATINGTTIDAPEQDNSGDPAWVLSHVYKLRCRTPSLSMRVLTGHLEILVLAKASGDLAWASLLC